MKALGLDSKEFSQNSEHSLMWRGKHTQSKTWLQRWKKKKSLQRLSTQMLKPSHTESFEDLLVSSAQDFHANPSLLLEFAKALMTKDTYIHLLQMGYQNVNPDWFSSKMLKESFQQEVETQVIPYSLMSLETWTEEVMNVRGAYSQRVKWVTLTKEKESLSWATPSTMDHLPQRSLKKQIAETHRRRRPCNLREQVDPITATVFALAETIDEKNNWQTPRASNMGNSEQFIAMGKINSLLTQVRIKAQLMYPTPSVGDTEGGKQTDRIERGDKGWKLRKKNRPKVTYGAKLRDAMIYEECQDLPNLLEIGKNLELNPNWVEQLMGLPKGWTDCDS